MMLWQARGRDFRMGDLKLRASWLACALVAGCSARPAKVVMATFNVGLAPGDVALTDERKPGVIAALAAEAKELDVLCVQEFWREQDFNDLIAATAAELPYTLRPAAMPGPTGCAAADAPDLAAIAACVQTNCPGATGSAVASCVLESCADAFFGLSDPCQGCLTEDLSPPVALILQKCSPAATGANPDDTPALFGGAFDVGLLSRHPFLEQDHERLDAFMVRVAVLYGKVATDAGDLHVFCTHLTSTLAFAYAGAHDDYQQEHAFEVQQLLDFVHRKVPDGGNVVLLGDLNCGPAVRDTIVAEWPEDYDLLMSGGFADPYVRQADASCTSCPGNTLKAPDSDPTLEDHILVQGLDGSLRVERRFTDPIAIEVGGTAVTSNLSDHYGLRAQLER
jgi:endonuclease/exonuclease/phosphatase family metal-dependent hydrolase